MCEFQLKTTNTLLNRLVLAGLLEARKLQPRGPLRRRAERQAFTWRGLAEPLAVVPRHDLDAARALLTRQTAHYNGALALTESLLFGTRTPGEAPAEAVDLPVYDLAVLFESLVAKLVSAAAVEAGMTARVQHTRRDALLDAEFNVYRRIRPDVVVYDQGLPVAVLDAKYKPRYTMGGPEPAVGNRVSVADAYQLFFYAERLRRLHHTAHQIPAFVVAPLLTDPEQLPRLPRRTITWQREGEGAAIGLRVVPVPVIEVLDVVLDGGSFGAACLAAPELLAAVRPPARVST
jgi:5-methylcytosine-specific restriction endonuclease McrBC regulatory subunit McrC